MSVFTLADIEDDLDEAGVHADQIGRALVTWVAMQNGTNVTVAEAMKVFNTTQEVIHLGVKSALWISIITGGHSDPSKQLFELDGE